MRNLILVCGLIIPVFFAGCKKSNDSASEPNLIFKFRFDSTQARLDNTGQPSAMPAGNAGLSPRFNSMSTHYLELAPNAFTPLGNGEVLYRATETNAGGSDAIDFQQSVTVGENEVFFSIPLSKVKAGEYEWLRLSLAYQNYDIRFFIDTVINGIPVSQEFPGTVASFIGFNTYITSYKINNETIVVNGNKKQGYWGFETNFVFGGVNYPYTITGQAPEGATTVVNPLFASSPVPPGSCVVTAAFNPGKLKITGNETSDIVVEVSLSTNKSFEWTEVVHDGRWEPSKGEQVVDMGIRGMIPKVQ